MRFGFGFHALLGPVYGQGADSHDGGNMVFVGAAGLVVPVGNRVNSVDLRHNRTRTLPFECRGNIAHVVVSPDERVLVAIDTRGSSVLVAMPNGVEVGRFTFKSPVTAARFSPDGKWLMVALGRIVEVYRAPSVDRKQFSAFARARTLRGAFDSVETIEWSADSKHALLGSRDMTTRVYSLERGRRCGVLGGNRDFVVAVAFGAGGDKTVVHTVSRDARMVTWKWTYDPTLRLGGDSDDSDSDSDKSDFGSSSSSSSSEMDEEDEKEEAECTRQLRRGNWVMQSKHVFNTGGGHVRLKSAAFHMGRGMLVVGFSDGLFGLYSLDTMACVHTLSMGSTSVNAVSVNPSGDWLALASAQAGQLLVWEWQSETYVIKQQAHAAGIRRIGYSPDGRLLATGGQDGKVKLWDALSGACFVTFGEHKGPVTDLCFNPKGNAVFSSSMDGTIRGFDLTRYRNFRTLASPNPVQFSCVAMDPSGEIICAGTMDDFTVYVFNVQTGALLEVLSGHQAPVSRVLFSPTDPVLASCSWDGSVRLNSLFGRGRGAGGRELLRHGETGRDVVCAAFRQDGLELAVGLLDGSLHFWDPKEVQELGSIDGRQDIWAGRGALDVRRAGRQASHFEAVAYASGGEAVLAVAAGSRFVLMYGVASKTLLKRFVLSENATIEGVLEVQNSRLLTDFGPVAEVAPERAALLKRQQTLPGAPGSVLSRDVAVNPSGDEFCALTSEGVHVFRLDFQMVLDAPGLSLEDTPEAVREALVDARDPTRALAVSLGLDSSVTPLVLPLIRAAHVPLVASSVPVGYLPRLLTLLAEQINLDKPDLHLYLLWIRWLLGSNFRVLSAEFSRVFRQPVLAVQRALFRKMKSLATAAEGNLAMLRFLVATPPPPDLLLEDEDGAALAMEMGEVEGEEEQESELMRDVVDDRAEKKRKKM
jgi:periodic tryptophan protein 2